jgi:ABC-2 type transport system permease protein
MIAAHVMPAWALARRELSSYFRQPAGWIVIALFLLLTGVVFAFAVLVPARPASMRAFFDASGWLLLPVAPAISMRLLAEEFRTGTVESLMTAPVSTPALVLGKFFGSVLFLIAMLVPTLVYPITLMAVSDPAPDIGPVIAGYLCLLLLGVLYLSLGLLASSATANATLAFIVTLFLVLALLLVGTLSRHVEGSLRELIVAMSLPPRLTDFARGVVATNHIVWFVTLSALACCGAMICVQWRRWR